MALVRLFTLYDQADLKDIAQANGVNAGVCGYVAVVLATALRARPAPVTESDLTALVEELRASAIDLMRKELPSAIEEVRRRRHAYLDAHPEEFAEEGCTFEESKDALGRPRISSTVFLESLCSDVDVLTLLGRTFLGRGPEQARIPLARTVQKGYFLDSKGRHETHTEIVQGTALVEERECMHRERAFILDEMDEDVLADRLVGFDAMALPPDDGKASWPGWALEGEVVRIVGIDDNREEGGNRSLFVVARPVTAKTASTTAGDEEPQSFMTPGSSLSSMLLEDVEKDGAVRSVAPESYMGQQKKHNSHVKATSTEWCNPIVVNVGGHYDVAVPLRLDGCPVLAVFESLPHAEVTIFHKILASAWISVDRRCN